MADRIVQLVDENDNNIFPVASVANAANITMTDTDPGEGSPLAAGQYVAVYDQNKYIETADIADHAVTSDKIDFTTFDFGEKREVGKFGNYTVYAQTFQNTIGAINTWKSFGNIGTGKIGLFAFGSFVTGTENYFFPGGTTNTEITSIYYDGSTGTVNVKTIYSFPVNTSARVTIFWLE